MFNSLHSLKSPSRWSAIVLVGTITSIDHAADLSNNLGNINSGVESASGSRWLAASFKTDASAHTLTSVTLLLANSVAGTAQLSLYSDAVFEPGSLISSLTSPASYSASLANTTFTSSGASLSANTTYWIVLRAVSGQFDWGWTSDNSATGAGFLRTWGVSDDAGSFWWSHDIYQTQMGVVVDVTLCAADVTGNHTVDIDDLVSVITAWGPCPAPCPAYCPADVNHTCSVNIDDLVSVITSWGSCP